MENFISILGLVFGLLGGGGAFLTWLFYRKQEKRFKNAEAVEKEVETLRNTIKTLEENQKFYDERLKSLQDILLSKESYIAVLSKDKDTIEIKHAKNKGALNRAYECKFCPDVSQCPVLKARTKNEEEYLRKLEEQK